jgi:hypothetical protein
MDRMFGRAGQNSLVGVEIGGHGHRPAPRLLTAQLEVERTLSATVRVAEATALLVRDHPVANGFDV